MPRKRWLLLALSLGAAFVYFQYRRGNVSRALENFRRYSMPNVASYDFWAGPVLGGFYTRVAKDLAGLLPQARVIEIGPGPGHLAVKLAQNMPSVQVTGVDISPEMVERANSLAAKSGVADRVKFQVGDVSSLPYPDASFDVAVSTFSLHHWPEPVKGLAEIYRVLRPGGSVWIYDLVDWISRIEQRGPGITELVRESPFEEGGSFTRNIVVKLGLIPLIYRAILRREQTGT